jgi:hypothetical protein
MAGRDGLLESFSAVSLVVANSAKLHDVEVSIGKYRRFDSRQDRGQL